MQNPAYIGLHMLLGRAKIGKKMYLRSRVLDARLDPGLQAAMLSAPALSQSFFSFRLPVIIDLLYWISGKPYIVLICLFVGQWRLELIIIIWLSPRETFSRLYSVKRIQGPGSFEHFRKFDLLRKWCIRKVKSPRQKNKVNVELECS